MTLVRNKTQRHSAALKNAGQNPVGLLPLDGFGSAVPSFQLRPVFGVVSSRVPPGNAMSRFVGFGDKSWDNSKNFFQTQGFEFLFLSQRAQRAVFGGSISPKTPNMSRALSRDKFGQTPCFSGPGLIIWPASLPRWTCLDRRASSQSNIRGFAGRAAAASDRRGSPPRALYVAGVASQFVATAGGVTFGLKSLPAGVPREQRPRE